MPSIKFIKYRTRILSSAMHSGACEQSHIAWYGILLSFKYNVVITVYSLWRSSCTLLFSNSLDHSRSEEEVIVIEQWWDIVRMLILDNRALSRRFLSKRIVGFWCKLTFGFHRSIKWMPFIINRRWCCRWAIVHLMIRIWVDFHRGMGHELFQWRCSR